MRGKRQVKTKARHGTGDRGYDSESHRYQLRQWGIEPTLAKRRTEQRAPASGRRVGLSRELWPGSNATGEQDTSRTAGGEL